ncbi:MAG: hypothetical protein ABEJ88_00720 [Halobacterium sp.]
MTGTNPDGPTDVLADCPERVDDSRLVGVDATGVPIYYDETDERAFEALQSDGSWVLGEERTAGELADVVDDVARLTGWEGLAEFAPGGDED